MNIEDTKVLEDLTLYSVNFTDDPLSGHEIAVVEATGVPTEQPQYRVTLDDQPKPPLLNRAQRRQIAKATRHRAAVQARHDLAVRRRAVVKALKYAKMRARQAKYAAGIID